MSASKKKKNNKKKKKNSNKTVNKNIKVNNKDVNEKKEDADVEKNTVKTEEPEEKNIEKNEEPKEKNIEKLEQEKETTIKNEVETEQILEPKKEEVEETKQIHEDKVENGTDEVKKENEVKTKTEEKPDEKPEYVQEMLKNKKRKKIIAICLIAILLFIILFSTIFAIINTSNSNIITGVKINNINVSKFSAEEAKQKITEITDAELLPEITLNYGDDYNITLKPEQIEFKYDIQKAITDAYQIGRDDNIIKNNYEILGVVLFNKNIDIDYTYNEDLLKDFINNLSTQIPNVVVDPSFYIEEKTLFIDKGKDGIAVDKQDLENLIIESISKRTYDEVSKEGYSQIIEIPTYEAQAKDINIDEIHDNVYREPKNAYFETDPYNIYVDVDGVDFAITKDEAKELIAKENKDEYTIPLKISKAEITINDLGMEAFPYLISSFSTKYDASNINRSTNLEIATKKIDGKVLMPDEIFSFNAVVGKRTIEDGYKDAKIYADGGVVDGLAGGICQISSTLYNAALLANLEIVERKNHSYPTSYIQAGRDATVVYGVKDLKFKNSRAYPIKIEAKVKNGVAEFKMYGIQEAEEYEIKILPVTTGTIPYGTSYTPDASLAPGAQVVSQSGHMGYYVTTYIEKRLNGELVSKEILTNDTYSPMQTIIRTGPAVAPAPVDPGIIQ